MKTLLLIFVLGGTAIAQNPISWASPVYHNDFGQLDRTTTFGLSLIYAGSVADTITTRQALANGAIETNPILRPLYARPAPTAEVVKFSANAFQVWAIKRWVRSCGPDRACQWTARVVAYATAGLYFGLATHNHHIANEGR